MSSPISTFLNVPTSPYRSRNNSPSRYSRYGYGYGRQPPLQVPQPVKAEVTYASKFEESPVQKMNAIQKQLDYILRELERFMSFSEQDRMNKLASSDDPFYVALAELRLEHAQELYADFYSLMKNFVALGGKPEPYEVPASDMFFRHAAHLTTVTAKESPEKSSSGQSSSRRSKSPFAEMMDEFRRF
ncbi:hypothetical protein TKK_0016983 [Trichogramma kaykai]|uniref:Uncharacterized protein n=1 Tax=Trichogramma kaykai TaxID=54128 RepID=A0ABD2W4S8_9HYME